MKQQLRMRVNGEDHELCVDPRQSLLDVLRYELGLMGAKEGCSIGYCGVCTVLIDGKSVKSCMIFALQAQGREITTIEGLAKDGKLHPIQRAFIDHFAFQCGFCTSGMILTMKSLLDENPNPTEEELRKGLIGNLCRCTGYKKIIEAGLELAKNKKN
jgi:aerobic-type carbon monoxide dehydrogenase small subunit (CoxS/CutS family)